MISNSKILTVSYGTFSCTLEGFDDSFGTMKAIAEYFRDLAADDRYFGAEPPTPDAEMLARIAERETARRVEAREDDGKIVLRAQGARSTALADPGQMPGSEDGTGSEQMPEEVATETAEEPEPTPEPEAAEEVTEASQPAESASAPATPAPAVTFTAPQPAPRPAPPLIGEAQQEEMTADIQDTPAPVDMPAPSLTAPAPAPETTQMDSVTPDAVNPVAEDLTDLPEPAPETTETDDPVTTEAAAVAADEGEFAEHDDTSIAAKLRRIRSVVARSGEDYGFDEDLDDNASAFLQTAATELDAALAADDAAAAAQDDALSDYPSDEEPAIADTAGEPEGGTPSDVEPPVDDTLAQLLDDALPDGADVARPLAARVVKVKQADLQDALDSGRIEDSDDEAASDENLFSEADTITGEDAPESGLSPEEEAELRRELAEVEAELGLSSEADKREADDLDALIGKVAESGQDLSDTGAEAETRDETDAEHELEFDLDHDDEPVIPERQEASVSRSPDTAEEASSASSEDARETLPEKGVDTLQRVKRDSELSRIFDETDTQRDEPDSSKRRNAIQHLRAAVAATRAEKKAGGKIGKDVDDTPYRSDLATVVRPRRPGTEAAPRSARPLRERPAPLKLVAEQRVDTERQPIQPRRVTAPEPSAASPSMADAGSFAEYVAETGAASLAELLEAAAAYMADVEGRPNFSRPMLMGKLKEVEGEGFSREEGLRSFGLLLRQGKLQKLSGGHFSVTDETEFRALKRNVG